MDKILHFQKQITRLLAEELPKLELDELTLLGTQVALYSFFEHDYTLEKILFEILDYCEEHDELTSLISRIDHLYSQAQNL